MHLPLLLPHLSSYKYQSHFSSLPQTSLHSSLILILRSAMSSSTIIILCALLLSYSTAASASNFYQDFDITWGDGRAKILNNGDLLTLSLDKASGSGFQSKNEYLFGKIDMQLQLVPGNSAGTVTAYYVSTNNQMLKLCAYAFLPQC